MEYARKLIEKTPGRFDLDENKLDLSQYYQGDLLPWEPVTKLPEYDTLTSVFLDIETYSNNQLVYDDFLDRLNYGSLEKHDEPMVKFVCNLIGDTDDERRRLSASLRYWYDMLSKKEFCNYKPSVDDRYQIIEVVENNKEIIVNHPKDIDSKGALYGCKGVITLIGLKNEKGRTEILDCTKLGEKVALLKMFDMLADKKPDILAHFNGFDFDLPFIVARCAALGIKHPFYISGYVTTNSTAQFFGKPQRYHNYWLNNGKTAICDLYHLVLAWDYVNKTLTAHNLKEVPLQLKLRKEKRLDLSYTEMKECVETGDMAKLKKYLEYDLEDTKLLADFLIPDYYYQKEILPNWILHKLLYRGMGSKWNDIIIDENKKLNPNFSAKTSDTVCFQGGLTGAKPGLYKKVSKFDVESLYPTMMLLYGIYSCKDTLALSLSVLLFQKNKRVALKKIAKEKKRTPEGKAANQRQGSYKVFINSGYGGLGTQGIETNDFEAACLVTGYGRAVLRLMIKLCIENGGTPISWDTDGLYYSSESFEKNKEIHKAVQAGMPGNKETKVILEYEMECDAFYVPPNITTGEGLRKNYIMISGDKISKKGQWKKRDNYALKNDFVPGLVLAYHKGEHEKYYQDILYKLIMQSYPVEKLMVTRKIKVNEKRLVDLGVGDAGEVVKIYKCADERFYGAKGQLLKKTKPVWTTDPSKLDWLSYISEIKEDYKAFFDCIETQKLSQKTSADIFS